ncbi:Na(+)/H(+) antiporter subunit B [Adhaeribacter aerolatus]|uniref:Na(+)/H(+) antiporter subunit B n=1 Tax=Adhaeribacter aerolatus TaxID=670289 RepID=A0A512B211_9BACT|nr:Na+/H+ antiporter subunit B [Adhaeribacter aerolatus]GEO05837.1 Na(+)/H(+) antiporter subunit B [Adhaeribacter aerolatus]
MRHLTFKTATNFLLPLLLLFSIFILLRGHYLPGGGFVGGIIAAIAFVLHAFAFGLKDTRKLLKIKPMSLMPAGLALAVFSAILPIFQGLPIMTGLWMNEPIPVIGLIGTALLFDLGVYIVVLGVALTIIFTISESV